MFNFDYRWEVYKPVANRQYGYYVLPILYGDRFVARFEPGKNRSNGTLIIKNWWWEPEIEITEELRTGLCDCFKAFTNFLGLNGLQIYTSIEEEKGLGWLTIFA
ncbi:MAG TPA: crosslink repair DNA glycosylase YcaQ family protein [Spirochaetia bacterium]|nr:crosslink repair DNA glycosylase YcaQ family protein [Spirochaetia bacterium]